jgi:hypothetical protein
MAVVLGLARRGLVHSVAVRETTRSWSSNSWTVQATLAFAACTTGNMGRIDRVET